MRISRFDSPLFRSAAALLAVTAAALLPLCSASADIARCGEVWTNLPCKNSQPAFKEKKPEVSDKEAALHSRKRSLFTSFDLERTRLERKHRIVHDVSLVRDACLERDTDIDDCRDAITESQKLLQQKVRSAQEMAALKRTRDAERSKVEQNVVSVTQNDERIIIVRPGVEHRRPFIGREPRDHRWHDHDDGLVLPREQEIDLGPRPSNPVVRRQLPQAGGVAKPRRER